MRAKKKRKKEGPLWRRAFTIRYFLAGYLTMLARFLDRAPRADSSLSHPGFLDVVGSLVNTVSMAHRLALQPWIPAGSRLAVKSRVSQASWLAAFPWVPSLIGNSLLLTGFLFGSGSLP